MPRRALSARRGAEQQRRPVLGLSRELGDSQVEALLPTGMAALSLCNQENDNPKPGNEDSESAPLMWEPRFTINSLPVVLFSFRIGPTSTLNSLPVGLFSFKNVTTFTLNCLPVVLFSVENGQISTLNSLPVMLFSSKNESKSDQILTWKAPPPCRLNFDSKCVPF